MNPRFLALLLLVAAPAFGSTPVAVVGERLGPAGAEAAARAAGIEGAAVAVSVAAGGWQIDGASLQPCATSDGPRVWQALESAGVLLRDAAFGDAAEQLRSALDAAPCAGTALSADDLVDALEDLGRAAQLASRDELARTAYGQLLALAPDHALRRTPPGAGYEELFLAVRAEASGNAVPVRVAGPATLWWDGRAVTGAVDTAVPPGRHLLQWLEGGVVQGHWVDVGPAGAVLVDAPAPSDAADPSGPAWFELVRRRSSASAVVQVLHRDPLEGLTWDGRRVTAWSAAPTLDGVAMRPDRLRITLGAGGSVQVSDAPWGYVDALAAAEIRLGGPVHLAVEGGVSVTPPQTTDHQGGTAVFTLPGVGAGIAIRPAVGAIQPFARLTVGVWFVPGRLAIDAERAPPPLAPRIFVEGGVDLVPRPGPVGVRLIGGAGYGHGFQARGGAALVLRLGRR